MYDLISGWEGVDKVSSEEDELHITSLIMQTEMVLESSVSFIHLTRLIAREDFIEELPFHFFHQYTEEGNRNC
jgi:hypothetical protein